MRYFMLSVILMVTLSISLVFPLEAVSSQGVTNVLGPHVSSSSRFTPLFEDDFERYIPTTFAYNGSLPLDALDVAWGWGQMDVDAILNVNEEHPEGIIWGRSGIWIIKDPAKAHRGENCIKFWMGHWTGGFTPEQAIAYWGSQTVYDMIMKRWPQELPQLYVRWYMKFDSLPKNKWEYVRLFYLLGMRYTETTISAYEASCVVSIENIGDGYSIGLSKLWGKDSLGVPVNLTLSRWYCFEIWYKSGQTDGEYKLWLDGKELISLTGLNATPPEEGVTLPTGFDIGLADRSNTIENVTAWMDDVVVADYRVGPLNWTLPSVNLTIQVIDELERAPIYNASVRLGSYMIFTDESGFARFNDVQGFTSYILNISRFRYKALMKSMDIYDEDLNLSIPLERIPEGKGCLEVQAYKENKTISAVVSFTDEVAEKYYATPFIADIVKGPQNITARYGDQVVNKTVNVKEGRLVSIDVEFPILNGTLEIRSYRETEEVVSTIEIGQNNSIIKITETPVSIELSPGVYELNLVYGNRTLVKNCTVEEGRKSAFTFYFEPEIKQEYGYIRDLGMIIIPVAMVLGLVILFKIR